MGKKILKGIDVLEDKHKLFADKLHVADEKLQVKQEEIIRNVESAKNIIDRKVQVVEVNLTADVTALSKKQNKMFIVLAILVILCCLLSGYNVYMTFFAGK